MVLERPDLARLHLAQAEVVEDRLLDVGVDAPLVAVGLCNPYLTPVEGGDDGFGVAHRTPRMISAARAHSASVGTSAKRT